MAKLNVNVMEMTNGEITEIEHGGKRYEPVTGTEIPSKGDIFIAGRDCGFGDFRKGSYYEATGRGTFLDDAGDSRGYADLDNRVFGAIFRAKKTHEDFAEGDRVKLLDGGGEFPLMGFDDEEEYTVVTNNFDHPHGRMIRITEKEGTSEAFDGYAKPSQLEIVKTAKEIADEQNPKFDVGDHLKVTELTGGVLNTEVGDIVKVTEVVKSHEDKNGGLIYYEVLQTGARNGMFGKRFVKATEAEVKQAKAATQPALKLVDRKAREGDFIKVLDIGFLFDINVTEGELYEVDEIDEWGDPQIIDDNGDSFDCDNLDAYEVYEKAEEVEAAEDDSEEDGPFSPGDFVSYTHDDEEGYGTVLDGPVGPCSGGNYDLRLTNGERKTVLGDNMTLQPKPTIEEGDIVRTVSGGGSLLTVGEIGVVGEFYGDAFRVNTPSRKDVNWVRAEHVELIAKKADRHDL